MDNNRSPAGATAGIPEPTGIVSVNDRGGKSTGMAAKLGVVLLALGVLAVGALYTFNHLPARAGSNASSVREQRNDTAPPGMSRRVFNTETATAPAKLPSVPSSTCPEGATLQPVPGPDGKPLHAPSGEPLLACGSVMVPSLEPMPTATSMPPFSGASGQAEEAYAFNAAAPRASRYGGDVVLPQPGLQGSGSDQLTQLADAPDGMAAIDSPSGSHSPSQQGPLSTLLKNRTRASGSPAVMATMIGDSDMILPRGRSIDCNLTVRLVNEVSGMASCVLSSHAYSDSGRVILAERGSVVTGDYIAQMAQGQRSLFVVWTRLQTPKGVVIDINSPGADALGTAGLPGYVDNRWGERIGAAVLLSLVEDAFAYQTAKAATENGAGGAQGVAVFQNSTQTGRTLAERILDSTINIKPTLYKNQGDRATIFVSQDLDFGSVYALRTK